MMNIEELYSKVAIHALEGVMFHDQMNHYYDFLGLKGYSKDHEYHSAKEYKDYAKIWGCYLNRSNKLMPPPQIENKSYIPSSWLKHVRQDVDPSTKKDGIKNGLNLWVEWERNTKTTYESLYKETDDVETRLLLEEMIKEVSEELHEAELCQLELKAADYDLSLIISEQNSLYEEARIRLVHLYF